MSIMSMVTTHIVIITPSDSISDISQIEAGEGKLGWVGGGMGLEWPSQIARAMVRGEGRRGNPLQAQITLPTLRSQCVSIPWRFRTRVTSTVTWYCSSDR
jgi:hypothetical protein